MCPSWISRGASWSTLEAIISYPSIYRTPFGGALDALLEPPWGILEPPVGRAHRPTRPRGRGQAPH
eukprot:9484887-Pyramimonas_sp.AAC.1